ncbi:MAG TPA: hypothetical protein VMW27_02110 [Thermoanaerobaculia bacterium]|nr:hypothetical protein [Thermoanaerobaculia bacterium]
MGHRDHPTSDALLRFLAGEASKAERRAIVRHLLTGCRECIAVTRPVWLVAKSPMRNLENLEKDMTDLQEVRDQLRIAVRELEDLRTRLLGIQASLPLSPADTSPEDMEEPATPASEMHAVLGCVVRDYLDPLIRDLRGAAG